MLMPKEISLLRLISRTTQLIISIMTKTFLIHFQEKPFSVLHLNIRSLQANFDALSNFLCDLQYQFSLIGLTETKQKIGKDQTSNTTLPEVNSIKKYKCTDKSDPCFHKCTPI